MLEKPIFLQGLYPFEGAGLDNPRAPSVPKSLTRFPLISAHSSSISGLETPARK